jgi:hypothetical protein
VTPEAYDHGVFCWNDLATSDPDGAKTFYSALFGWTIEDTDMGTAGIYTILRLNGGDVGGVYALGDEEGEMGAPSHWNAYVAVDSCDETAATARQLGGKVISEPFDIPEAGRMAVIGDPQEAVLCLWQKDSFHAGAARRGPIPGSVCWNELATTDAAGAEAFYTRLLGWASRSGGSIPGIPYTEFLVGERSVGGMLEMTDEWGGAPPHWLVYFSVVDCDESVAKARDLGGAVIKDSFDIPNVGRMAVLADPQGAVFAVIKLEKTC